MLSNLFGGQKEEWKVEVVKEFSDVYIGMGMDEYERKITVGSTATATIDKKGRVVVKFDTLRNIPHNEALKLYFKKEDERYSYFNWLEKTKDPAADSKIKKSSLFS